MSQTLCFNDVQFDVIQQNQVPWVRSPQIAEALGYGQANRINDLYTRHADEFTPAMTAVVTLPTEGGPQETRIFSLRGCHLLAMFARTPVAKQFRRWVLDVIEQYGDQVPVTEPAASSNQPTSSIVSVTPSSVADRKPLRSLVNAWALLSGHPFGACWNQVKAAFRLTDIRDLPQEWISDAIAWVQAKIDAVPKALPTAQNILEPAPAFRTDFPADMTTGRKDALKKIQSLMAGVGAARDVVRLFCHPGGKSMSMTLDEREIYDALYQLYCAADDSLLAAYRALDAGYKIGRQYGRG